MNYVYLVVGAMATLILWNIFLEVRLQEIYHLLIVERQKNLDKEITEKIHHLSDSELNDDVSRRLSADTKA